MNPHLRNRKRAAESFPMENAVNPQPFTLRARWVFPVDGPPLAGGSVTIAGGRIAAVGAPPPGGRVEDLGNVAILPGFVNAHTHLDLSDVPAPLGRPGIGLVDWIAQLIVFRVSRATPAWEPVARGLEECARCGTTGLGEIAQPAWPAAILTTFPLDCTIFQELIGPTADRVAPALELARQHMAAGKAEAWRPGLAPHAPYSVHPELLGGVVKLAAVEQVPVAFHLAESREEIEFLQTGGGPLRQLLEALGAWQPGAIRPGTRALDFLRVLAEAPRALVIHGNYLDDEELAFLADHAERMTVIYCPRTHAWFEHRRYPLEKMLSMGVAVALGTDSRASSPDLSLLAELRAVAAGYPAVAPEVVLQLGTSRTAAALGREDEAGSLTAGKLASLAIVALPEREAADPHELLFDSDRPVVGRYYRGRRV
jgi:cytosine/adenosine deaminase-related metal-dependent hydrolase